jgi:hypothetical protein
VQAREIAGTGVVRGGVIAGVGVAGGHVLMNV